MRDEDGELAVIPKLLHWRASLKLVEQAIDLFEAALGKTRSEYDTRALEAVMGDYRLGRCIEACLLIYYAFVQPGVSDVLAAEEVASLQEQGLDSPSALRLALWDAANERGGFVAPEDRENFLRGLASQWGLGDPRTVDTLLSLDNEAAAVLTRTGERPTSVEILRLYNRGMVKTLLAHSTQVHFSLGSLPGDALRRLYFIAKRSGVLVDVEGDRGSFGLTLYGPEQAFGSADKYGRRLADASLSLLCSLLGMAGSSEVHGTAHLLLHERTYRFHLTERILEHLEYSPVEEGPGGHRVAEQRAAYSVGSVLDTTEEAEVEEPTFDSLVEAALYRTFRSLEKQGYTQGWLIRREPDPLLAPGVVLIPDFAFERGDTRVYMEVAGFWSPSYKERKVAKLRALTSSGQSNASLILAVPNDAVQTFSGLSFPVVSYKKELRATDLLNLLNAQYGGREERQEAAQAQFAALQKAALERGLVPEREVADTLSAYSRTELLALAPGLETERCRYVPGVGLLSLEALESAHASLRHALDATAGHRISLEQADELAATTLSAGSIDVEALVQLWPDFAIERPSLFESFLVLA